MYQISLFTGAMGGDLATVHLLGWRPVLYCEINEYCQRLIRARIRDGFMPDAPIWGDIGTLCETVLKPYQELAQEHDVAVTAGFPCQPFAAGGKQLGEDDPRNKWPDTVRVAGIVKPRWLLLENSPNLLTSFRNTDRAAYIDTIQRDLAAIGYCTEWDCISAYSVGAEHKRQRLWIVAYPCSEGREVVLRGSSRVSQREDRQLARVRPEARIGNANSLDAIFGRITQIEESLGEASVCGSDDGLAHRVDRLEAIGNGQVPAVVEKAWRVLGDDVKYYYK